MLETWNDEKMVLLQGSSAQQARIASGLVLFLFALTHFLNHAAGLFSLDAMQAMQNWRTGITRSWLGTIVLLAALAVHVALGLARIAARSSFRMPWWEAAQILLGLAIPFLLLPHIVNTRIAHTFFGVNDIYIYELARLWPASAVWQSTLMLMVWAHGCIGLHYWLRLWEPYRRATPVLAVFAALVPIAGILGFASAGSQVAVTITDPAARALLHTTTAWPSAAADARLAVLRGWVYWGLLAMLAGLAAVLFRRQASREGQPHVLVSYNAGPTVAPFVGPTLLEISRMYNVPHTAVCGGRGRCSTCRVRIDDGQDSQDAPQFVEAVALGSIGAPANVRLACQLRPRTSLTVTRLLRPSSTGPSAAGVPEADSDGVERILALMFLDVRNFTRMMEHKLPYDVVFILNEFFAATGQAITSNGGAIDKFMGDGLLAVFGRKNGPEEGCRHALQAARAIDLALDHVNARLQGDLTHPIEIGIGIHVGPVLMGRIGWGEAVDMTVIGHTVNAASRLEALTKEKKCQLVISREVAQYAGLAVDDSGEEIQVRGIAKSIRIVPIHRGRDLPPHILSSSWPV